MSDAASGMTRPTAGPAPGGSLPEHLDPWLRLHGGRDSAILATASFATAAGFVQSSATFALADVARSFREPSPRSAPATGGSWIAAAVVAAAPCLPAVRPPPRDPGDAAR